MQTTDLWERCARHTGIGAFGLQAGEIDTLVLGCTHYIFVKDELRALLGPDVQLIDTGAPVARQTRRLLAQSAMLAPEATIAPSMQLYATGGLSSLQAAAERWLGLPPSAARILILTNPLSGFAASPALSAPHAPPLRGSLPPKGHRR